MFPWHWEPIAFVQLLAVEVAYLLAVGPLRGRFRDSQPVSGGTATTFSLGIFFAALAIVSPLDALSERYLFSAHMVQHLLLTLVVSPLVLLGTPAWLLGPLARQPLIARPARVLTRPLPALIIFNVIFLGWHAPQLYELALRVHNIHILEHLMMLGAAVICWWPVLSPTPEIPRATYPLQLVYLFLQSIPPTILGALLTFTGEPLSPTYLAAPRLWDLSVLDDQKAAGMIMWIPGSLAFFGALTVVWFSWIKDTDEPDAPIYGETVEGRRA
jgi:putative membrane protein